MSTKPSMPSPLGAMGETFDLIQKMWGGMGMPTPGNLASMAGMPQQMPSMLAPTVDVGELDKRIADLRAVAQWLELNASMLRTTIQTLEVQRATIATLKGISGAMLAPILGASEPARTPSPFATLAEAAASRPPAPQPSTEAAPPAAQPARRRKRSAPHAPSLAEDALNPAAWWHTLQDQFAKIAAVASEAAPAEEEPPRRAKKARRPRNKA